MSGASSASLHDFLYRFDVYISLNDQNRKRVAPATILRITDEIVNEFGGLTMTSILGNPVYDGFWTEPGTKEAVKDKNSILTVLAPQTAGSINFFLNRKTSWETALDYKQLLITVHELQVI